MQGGCSRDVNAPLIKRRMDTRYEALWQRLTAIYDADEAKAVVRWLLDVRFGLTLTDIVSGKLAEMNDVQKTELEAMMQRLEAAEPVQYVVGESDFCGRPFSVAPGVLIPRPETEELCQWISNGNMSPCDILDIGTGSGCIAITLALDNAAAKVTAWDISEEALAIARKNAEKLHANVTFEQCDILGEPPQRHWDIIVSNPPYICDKEKAAMNKNVLDYEPHQALFVPNEDPLRFYRAIGAYAAKTLNPSGALYFELNPLYAEETAEMLETQGFTQIEIRQDQFGKKRFLRSCVNSFIPKFLRIKKK